MPFIKPPTCGVVRSQQQSSMFSTSLTAGSERSSLVSRESTFRIMLYPVTLESVCSSFPAIVLFCESFPLLSKPEKRSEPSMSVDGRFYPGATTYTLYRAGRSTRAALYCKHPLSASTIRWASVPSCTITYCGDCTTLQRVFVCDPLTGLVAGVRRQTNMKGECEDAGELQVGVRR